MIQLIEHTPVTTYVGCHWPVKTHGQIAEFCRESRDFVEKADVLLLSLLSRPHSLREMCEQVAPQLGEWPRAVDLDLAWARDGHVKRWLDRGKLRANVPPEAPRVLELVRK